MSCQGIALKEQVEVCVTWDSSETFRNLEGI